MYHLAFAALSIAMATSNLCAASLRISPTVVEFKDTQSSQSLSVYNQSAEPTRLQARIFQWKQENGKDVLVPSSDLVVSPPIMTLNQATSYNYRIVRLNKAPIQGQESYRLILDELPKPADPQKPNEGLNLLLRLSLPIFITNPTSKIDLKWKFTQDLGQTYISIDNLGNRNAYLSDLKIVDSETKEEYTVAMSTLSGYILGGQKKDYTTPKNFVAKPNHPYALVFKVNGAKSQL